MLSVYSVGNDREVEKMKLFYILLTVPPVLNMVLLIKPFSSGGGLSRVGVFRGHPFSLGRSGRKSGGKVLGNGHVNRYKLSMKRESLRQCTHASAHC